MHNRSMPPGTFIPELGYADVAAAAAWLCRAFGFQERLRIGDHRCQLVFGDGSMVVVEGGRLPDGDRTHAVMVSVPDVDQHYARAVAAGARIVRPPETHPFGERQYTAADLGGHQWTFSQSVADIDPAAWGGQLTEPESQPMELCDLVDEQGAPTSRTVPRGTPLAPGEYYQVVHVWIRNEAGEYLVQQRAHDLDTDPDVWAVTAGYVQAGEDRMSAAVRETREELGLALQPDQLRRLRQQALENRFEDVWLATVTRAALGPPQPGPEVADWKWASKAALSELIGRGEFFRYSYFGSLPD